MKDTGIGISNDRQLRVDLLPWLQVLSLRVRIAVANWCEKDQNEASDPDNNRADWWFLLVSIPAGVRGHRAPGARISSIPISCRITSGRR